MGKDNRRREAVAPVTALRAAKADFDALVVVCAKCAKRQGLPKRELGRSLKRALKRETRGRKVRVVETGCLGPCPKRMIAVATPLGEGRKRLVLLDASLPAAEVRGLLPHLGLEAPSPLAAGGEAS